MHIDEGIDLLVIRHQAEGLEVPPPVDAELIAATEAALMPLRLPAPYRRLLARHDPGLLPLRGLPPLSGLEFALSGWEQDGQIGDRPRVLFPVGYISDHWLSMELSSATAAGGELFVHGVGDDCAHLSGGLPAYLAALAMAPIRTMSGRGANPSADLDAGQLRSGEVVDPSDVQTWPHRWLDADALARRDLEPRGGAVPIRVALERRMGSSQAARVHVRVVSLTGTVGYSVVTVRDETGSMVLRWPNPAGPADARIGSRFELDIRTHPVEISGPRHRAAATRAARAVTEPASADGPITPRDAAERLIRETELHGVDGFVTGARRLER